MRLVQMRIRNFRCFQKELTINFEDISAFVGKNDAGKSSIMDALDIFLNDNVPDKHDASKHGKADDLTIICEFDSLPDQVIIDEDFCTTLKEEYLLNSEGRLEIHKTYNGSLATPKCTNISAFAIHPINPNVKDLLQLKNSDLKKRAKELAVDLSNVDQKINAQLRNKIRQHVGDLKLEPIFIPLNENNAKDIWIGLKKYLPAFALFKSDRASTDQDSEAQDPLKAAVKEAIKLKEKELNDIVNFVETEVKKIASGTLQKLKEMDASLASQLNPQFILGKWDSIFKASITGDGDIPINKRGSGVRRLILLSFFRAKAEQLAKEAGKESVIYGIEEPETSQHPNNQRMLLRALVELSEENQVIITTHTPMFARALPDKAIRFINIVNNKEREILSGSETTNRLFSKSLGVLADNNVKLFIGVEGKHDISFLQHISKTLLSETKEILDLEKLEVDGEVIFFPCGGTNLALWTSRLSKLNRPEFHLRDRDISPPDVSPKKSYIDEINKRPYCKAVLTEKREIENYLHKDAIIEAYKSFNITLAIANNFNAFDDVPLEVAKLVHSSSGSVESWDVLNERKKEAKISSAKKILNGVAPKYMNLSRLQQIDPNDELLKWLKDIKELFHS